MEKPKLLIITRNLPPLIGGMERLMWHTIDELKSDYQISVVGPTGCRRDLPKGVWAAEVPVKPLGLFFFFAFFSALCLAIRHKPKIVMAGSGLTAPFAWLTARLFRVKCVVYLHGLDVTAPYWVYRHFWTRFFRCFDHVITNSVFTQRLAINIGAKKNKISVLNPGVALPDISQALQKASAFRSKHQIGDDIPMILFVGRIVERKGLPYFVDHVFDRIIQEIPRSHLIVIGGNPEQSLQHHSDTRNRITSLLKEKQTLRNTLFLGKCTDNELETAYFSANLLIFPIQQHDTDVEGFGMVAVEAAAHGLPTVAFATGGVSDAVQDGCSGRLIPQGDVDAFADAVLDYLKRGKNRQDSDNCRNFAEQFEWKKFGARLKECFKKVL